MLYMVTVTINIPPMLAYIPAPWILWIIIHQPEIRPPIFPLAGPAGSPPRKQEPEIRPFGDDLPKYYLYIISIFT